MSELFNLYYLACVVVLIFVPFQQIREKHITFSIKEFGENDMFVIEMGILYHTISFYNDALLFIVAYLHYTISSAWSNPFLSWALTNLFRNSRS